MSNFQSKCMYCGSTSYGSGCIFSSSRIHVHTDDPTKCIYCGMMAYGSGCVFNPYTKMHIHGMDVGQAIKESTRKTVELTYLTDRLLENIKDSEAFKLKLINEKGDLLRAPSSAYEQRLVSPLNRMLNNIKKYITADNVIISESLKFLATQTTRKISAEEYAIKLQFEQNISHIIKQLFEIIKEHSCTLSLESLEESLESAILSNITDNER